MNKPVSVLVVLVLFAALFHGCRWSVANRPQRHTDEEEAQVGQTAARLTIEQAPEAKEVSILHLYAKQARPYDARSRALHDGLVERGVLVNEAWARDEGHYQDEDYSPSIEVVLRRHPRTAVLVVDSVGFVTHARVSPILRSFLARGGRLVLVGSTHARTPFVELARRGGASILARRQTWLAESAPHPQLADAPAFVRANYTILKASGM